MGTIITDLPYLWTGQTSCHSIEGSPIPCAGSGQDAEYRRGRPWPVPRFESQAGQVHDRLTGLSWAPDANLAGYPLNWQEALDFLVELNARRYLGSDDWRLPNRRELRSLISMQTRRPALPTDHPFQNVFSGWYWSSTTAAIAPAHAWYLHMEGGRMFYGGKDQAFLLWPVRGKGRLPWTGQRHCYDEKGAPCPCADTGQDAEWSMGTPWPRPRFIPHDDGIEDRLTGLIWWPSGDLTANPVTWGQALAATRALNTNYDKPCWRLPNINELESLVDADRYSPAVPEDSPFHHLRDVYWSSTTSMFEPDWAWALYLDSGAVGVGRKDLAVYHVWPVRDGDG